MTRSDVTTNTRTLRKPGATLARLAAAVVSLVVVGPLVAATPAAAAPVASAPHLGSAAGFSVLAGPSMSNTGATALALDLGVTGTLAGFPPGTVSGTTYVATPEVEAAHEDRQAAYDAVVAQTGGTPVAGDLIGKTFTPGLYSAGAAITNTGTITLDAGGDPNAVFVFQVGAALSSAAATKVVLTNSALAHNVYWQTTGAFALGAGAKWVGTVLSASTISFGEAASLKGRALSASTVALANNPVTQPIDDLTAPTVSIDGGASRSTNDTTPTVSGTTAEPGAPLVTLTIGSQVLTTRADNGTWARSTDALGEGPHHLVASVTDPSGNTGTASQTLTVDTLAPGVTILGGTRAATSDTTPVISGTADEPGTPTVTVDVGTQTLTTTATSGTWTVTAASLAETSHVVTASVVDAAGNTGTASQVLTVDVTVPVVTIRGGPDRSTTDTSPWIYGTTAEKAGTAVRIEVNGQSLTSTVRSDGTWGVSAQTLPPGTHEVVASITDEALNTGTARQVLLVDPTGTPDPTDPNPSATYRPDASIRTGRTPFIGTKVYGTADQRVSRTLRDRTRTSRFVVRVTNRGNRSEAMQVHGTTRGKAFKVVYASAGRNVTSDVVNARFRTATLRVGESATLTVTFVKRKGARPLSKTLATVRSTSTHAQGRSDAVSALVRVGG